MPSLREVVRSHGECNWLFDQAERLGRGLFDLRDGRVMIPFFTDHGPAHCARVERILDQILFPPGFDWQDPRLFKPTPEEAMYLLSAAWVHDIGMVYGIFPGETLDGPVRWDEHRDDHERRSARFVRGFWKIDCNWNDVERMQLGELCVFHRHRHPLDSIVETVTGRTGTPIRIRVLAALLRLADACHVDMSRAPSDMKNLFRSFGMPVRSTEHWGLASLVHEVGFEHATNTVWVHCYLPEPQQHGTATVDFSPVVSRIAQAIERELTTAIPYLSAFGNTDFNSVKPKSVILRSLDETDGFLRRVWPCVLALTTSASEAACMGAAVVGAHLRNVSELPRDELTKVLSEFKRLHPHNFLLRRLISDIGDFVQSPPPTDAAGRQVELATVGQYVTEFLKARRTSRTRVAELARTHIQSDDTLVIYGYSSTVLHLLTEVLSGHRGMVLMVKDHQAGQGLAVEEEHVRITEALRKARLPFRVVEMAGLRQIFAHFRKQQVKAKVLLGARGVFNGNDALTRMGTAMVASAASSCDIPVLVLAERDKKLPHGPIDKEIAQLLAAQIAALISHGTAEPQAAPAAAPSDWSHDSIPAVDQLTPDMYHVLVGTEEVEPVTAAPDLAPSAGS